MPNRMLRDWTTSDKMRMVSVHAERFFVRLIMKVDDYGCFYADTRLLKANLFPLLLDSIREADLIRWMAECQKADLIVLYESAGKNYLQIKDFRQRLDKSNSKYPQPTENQSVHKDSKVVNGFPPEEEVEIEEEKEVEGERLPPKPKREIQIVFRDSEIFDKEIFKEKILGTQYELANVDYYHEVILNWSDAKKEKKINWLATAKNWMAKDMKEGKLITNDFKPPQNGNTKNFQQPASKKVTGEQLDEAFASFYQKK